MIRTALNSLFISFLIVFVTSVHSESELTAGEFAKSINTFSCQFLKQLNYSNQNVVFSPISISMALGMVLKGANGSTADEIYRLLNLNTYSNREKVHDYLSDLMLQQILNDPSKDPNFRNISIELTNLILIAKNFSVEEMYRETMKKKYLAVIGKEDFAGNGTKLMENINKYIKERSHNLIPKLLDEPLKADTLLFLLNSIYFKAYWEHIFLRSLILRTRFFNSDKTNSMVDFLTEEEVSYHHIIDDKENVTILEMDYLGNASMIFILPNERYGLQRVLNNIPCDEIDKKLNDGQESLISVKIPKFKFDYEVDLKDILPKMGVNSIFNHPDLSGIATGIKVSEAKHKAVISVDEGGTEAAALTTVRITPDSLYTGPEFVANKPFLFFIRDKISGVNLFTGVVNKL